MNTIAAERFELGAEQTRIVRELAHGLVLERLGRDRLREAARVFADRYTAQHYRQHGNILTHAEALAWTESWWERAAASIVTLAGKIVGCSFLLLASGQGRELRIPAGYEHAADWSHLVRNREITVWIGTKSALSADLLSGAQCNAAMLAIIQDSFNLGLGNGAEYLVSGMETKVRRLYRVAGVATRVSGVVIDPRAPHLKIHGVTVTTSALLALAG